MAFCFSVIRGHIPQVSPLDTMGFLEASACGRKVRAPNDGRMFCWRTFGKRLDFSEPQQAVFRGGKEGRIFFPLSSPNFFPSPGLVWCSKRRFTQR